MAEQLIGPYKVVREIGRGGMGSVYEAVHPQIQRRVAIKVLHPQFAKNEQLVTRFFKEARAVNIVNHPSVVQISEFAQLPDGTAYIVMEFLEGESLGVRMKRSGGRLNLTESLRLSRQIAAALASAHSKGIIHRDLKPDNVMIVADPEAPGGERAKVLDFGIAKFASAANPMGAGAEAIEQMSQTQSGVMIGTPLYMAPEQCKGAVNVDDKADVYSLGVMLYRMLCGRPPFIGEGAGSVMAMHIYEPPPPLRDFEPSVPEDLTALVHRLLLKDPTQRPPMIQVAQALEQLKAIHTTGMLSSMELARVQQSGMLQAVTPIPTPIPLSTSQISAVGLGPIALHQTGHSHVGQAQLSASHAALIQSHHGLTPVSTSQSNPSHNGTPSSGNGVSVSQTFGHSAAQIAPEPKRRGVVVAVLGVSVLIGAALFGVVALRQPDAPKDKDPGPTDPRRSAVQQPLRKVRFQVASEPAGATVVRAIDQRELGQTPWQNEQPAGSGSLVLILRRTGYADRIVTLDQSANAVIKEALQPLPQAPQPQNPAVPVDARVRYIKKGGKRVAVPIAPAPAKGPAATAQASPGNGTSAPTPPTQPPPPVKQSPPPKEEPSHARIQMVD